MSDKYGLVDYTQRLNRAVERLETLKAEAAKDMFAISEETRLAGKIEGVKLALSYLRDV